MTQKSYLAFGDIHGCADQLQMLLARPDLYENRTAVFLGDYVDVGPSSRRVVDQLIQFQRAVRDAVFLKGNHDSALIRYLASGNFADYAAIGGIATIHDYCGDVKGDVRAALESALPSSHRDFFANLRSHLETETHLFSHCGYSPKAPRDRSEAAMVEQSHQDLFLNGPTLGKLAVCGHYFQRTLRPFLSPRVICLDTGCGILNGPLTAIQLPEAHIIQVTVELELIEASREDAHRLYG